ncbi:MAG: helix-turn-helix domain-containing protein [Eubacteriales bacterium]|nr:helix-turn-helix domain-containing protein [Eubacteriales bacterium]
MNQKQLVRLNMINQANSGFITVKETAEALGLSRRQVQRLKKYNQDGKMTFDVMTSIIKLLEGWSRKCQQSQE